MEPVAIVGFSFQLPQDAVDEKSFWKILVDGRNVMTDWPESRININAFHEPDARRTHTLQARGGHFIKQDPGVFDAPFFSITAKDATSMDPQQRMLLETTYRAFENAGMTMTEIAQSQTAVYEASMVDDYSKFISKDPDTMPTMTATGTAHSILANRISWFFDLQGPSIHVDTACSSSMVAVDLACQYLQGNLGSMAVVSGTNLLLGQEGSIMLSRMNFLSPDSLCYSFDHRANGYSRGEGIIVMILKRLSDAIANKDIIRAIIRATGTNSDGHTPNMTVPSVASQEKLIRSVYRKAGLELSSTRYVEAHGTGTAVGDPTEISAIGRVFRSSRSHTDPIYVGSVKSNIGHLEGASGLAGILKAIMVLERGIIPPNASFEKPNPNMDLDFYNIQISTNVSPWPADGVRRISVNSFGFGGTNSHAILDDAFHYLLERGLRGHHLTVACAPHNHHEVQPLEQVCKKSPRLLVWSASDAHTLELLLEQYMAYVDFQIKGDPLKLDRLAYTLASRRSSLLWRSFALVEPNSVASSMNVSKPVRSSGQTGLAFVFTGQGAQYVGMGKGLMQFEVFADTLQQINDIFARMGCQWSLISELQNQENINKPEYSQPLCTSLQIALVNLLESFGVVPDSVVGHSSGEIAAAYCIGALSLESACKVAYYRGLLAGRLARDESAPGAMISANIPVADVAAYLVKVFTPSQPDSGVTTACVNSSLNVTLSGPADAIDTLETYLHRDGIFAQKLNTGVAYHSYHMESIVEEYVTYMGDLSPRKARLRIPMVSTVTGNAITYHRLCQPEYWASNLTSPVKFLDALELLVGTESRAKLGSLRSKTLYDFVEVGPHCALRRPCLDVLSRGRRKQELRYTSTTHRSKDSHRSIAELIGHLFTYGYQVKIDEANKYFTSQDQARTVLLVDTPEYPFNHTQRYWHESRLSLNYRMREPVPRGVLGSQAHDWNPKEPKWRRFISTSQESWIGDHVVNGSTLYPATGMMIMAIEAVMQVSQQDRPIKAFYIKEALFSSPIVLRSSLESGESIETITSLNPIRHPYEKTSTWSEVWISTYQNGTWTECFRTKVQVQYHETQSQVDSGLEDRLMQESVSKNYETALKNCTLSRSSSDFYKFCEKRGLSYGPSFRILENICWDGSELAIGCVKIPNDLNDYQGLVHPAVLDAACQIFWIAPSRGLSASMPTEVPHRMRDVYLSATGWNNTTSVRIITSSRYKSVGRGVEGDLHMIADDGTLLSRVGRMEFDPIADDEFADPPGTELFYRISWQPSLSAMSTSELEKFTGALDFAMDEIEIVNYHQDLEDAVLHTIRNTLQELSEFDEQSAPSHVRQYIRWMQRQPLHEVFQRTQISSTAQAHELFLELETRKPSWRVFAEVARNLSAIIRGDVDPLSLIFSTNLAEDLYSDCFAQLCDSSKFHRILELATHQQPDLKILEVGGGTGGMTTHVLSALHKHEVESGRSAFSTYKFTDVSHAFFEGAQEKFRSFISRMEFQTLDLERDLHSQGIELAAYDIVIAGAVLHATSNLSDTIKNVRKALRPGGRLILFEITRPNALALNFGFGVLPGWWVSSESWRANAQGVDETKWDEILRQNGFSGNDLVLRDWGNDACHNFSVIVATATPEQHQFTATSSVVIVVDSNSAIQAELANCLRRSFLENQNSQEVRIVGWTSFKPMAIDTKDIFVSLLEFGRPVLNELDEKGFEELKTFLLTIKQLIWVSAANPETTTFSFLGMAHGFFRTLRSENSNKRLVTLSMEGNDLTSATRSIEFVFGETFFQSSPEVEYKVSRGVLQIARLVKDHRLDEAVGSRLRPRIRDEPWGQGYPLVFNVKNRGTLDSLEFIDDPQYQDDVNFGEYDVELEAKAWGLNFRDIFIALGRLEENDFGFDCAGIVRRVGARCRIAPGDRVLAAVKGSMRSIVKCQELEVIRMPDDLSFEDGAAICAPGITGHHCLVDVAKLRKGERILIHSATGATGQVSVQIAQWIGAEIFATVGTNEKKAFLHETYSIPKDHIFYSRNTSFAKGIMRMTQGEGVHVVLNSLSGDSLRASWDCVSPYGRFIEIGKVDIRSNAGLPMQGFSKNITFTAVDLHHVSESRKDITQHLLQSTLKLLESGAIRPPQPVHVYSIARMEEAFRYFQSGKNIGRIVISLNPDIVVPKRVLSRSTWAFDPNASYLISGGLGGIGRAISRWMIGKGAKHLILPTRFGVGGQAATALLEELGQAGVHVYAPNCDVSSVESLSAVLFESAKTMPPIRGCINAAMVLQDSIFEHMSYAQWTMTLRSKVQTSWNLHRLLPPNMDFFVLLSSLAGIYGSVSQVNYAAGNTYKDALARHRTTNGEKAVAFNLGWMKTVGIIAENADYEKIRAQSADMAQVELEELLGLLDIYCNPALPILDPEDSQVLVGVVTPGHCIAQGIEPPDFMHHPLFSGFSKIDDTGSFARDGELVDTSTLFREKVTREDRIGVVVQALATKLARALSMSPDDMDPTKALFEYGVDSLVAVELRNWISKEFAADIAVFDIMGGSTIVTIGELTAMKTQLVEK